jgi:hypothetical protein
MSSRYEQNFALMMITRRQGNEIAWLPSQLFSEMAYNQSIALSASLLHSIAGLVPTWKF